MIAAALALLLAAGLGAPRPCVHGVAEQRPPLTLAEQQHTRQIIKTAVARIGGSRDFASVLEIVAERESSLQAGLVHRLPSDLRASARAWSKLAALYRANPHYPDRVRWQTYGLFGMNSAIFAVVWDPVADPAVLCDPVVDVLVYARAAARVIGKAGRVVDCDGAAHRIEPTWTAIHAAVSGGRLCPSARDDDFRRRAARAGVDPDRRVRAAEVGRVPAQALPLVAQIWRSVQSFPAL